jgi:hypothetical protein
LFVEVVVVAVTSDSANGDVVTSSANDGHIDIIHAIVVLIVIVFAALSSDIAILIVIGGDDFDDDGCWL